MTRSPLFYPMNRGMDADAGGAADLQTDVMRFMAIISLCLVAIFALVQSIPLTSPPVIDVTPPEFEEPGLTAVVDAPVPTTPMDRVVLTRPEQKKIEPQVERPILQRPIPKPVAKRSPPDVQQRLDPDSIAQVPASRQPTDEQIGFTLRFESDDALTRLVSRNVVSLYAIGPDSVKRMSIDAGNVSFWTASSPRQFHEMDVSTVPATVLAAWRRSNGDAMAEIQWGVSLPPSMSRQLNQYLAEQSGGMLIIGAGGTLRLEH